MAAPPKPWERKGLASSSNRFYSEQSSLAPPINRRSTSNVPLPGRNFHSTSPSMSQRPPPLPARPSHSALGTSTINRYGYGSGGMGYGGLGYGSYGGGMYGNYGGMYSSYGSGMYGGGMGYGANRFGMGAIGNEPFSRFVQQAEESSRPAFQSIESIVQAFASVSMMLESTFHTVYNSFRAVLGVAEHFSRLKIHLAKIFSAIALFRFLRYLYRKLLVLIGLRSQGFAEEVWAEVESQAAEGAVASLPTSKQKKAPSWPILMFFAVVVGGPYIIWKLLSSGNEESETCPEWASGEDDHVVARAEFDFDADSEKELSFHAGDLFNLAPKDQQPRVRGWLLASSGKDKIGLVPANYVKILGKRRGRKYTQQGGDGAPSQNSGGLGGSGQPQQAPADNRTARSATALHSSQSMPANLSQTNSSAEFNEAFNASGTPNTDTAFSTATNTKGEFRTSRSDGASGASNPDRVFAPKYDNGEDRFVDQIPEEETDFIFSSDKANNPNTAVGADAAFAAGDQDFAGFEDTFEPESGTVNHQNPSEVKS